MRDSFPLALPYLDGVILAVNACEGVFLVVDGYGCHFNRAERFAGNHDQFSTLTGWRGFHRLATTQLESADMALGTGAKLRKMVAAIAKGARPEAIVVTPSVTVSVSGQNYTEIARELEAQWRVPVIIVNGPILVSDWLDGYADTLLAMAKTALAARSPARRPRRKGAKGRPVVAVIGNLMSRNEYDEISNLSELQRLLAMAGLRPAVTWLSGARYRSSRMPQGIDGVIGLPYGEAAAREISDALRVPLCLPGLPIGFSGTMAWVQRVAACFDTGGRGLRAADVELTDHVRRFSWAVTRHLAGRTVAVCADPHLALGLVPFLREVGIVVELLAIESRHDRCSGRGEFAGIPTVLTDPTYRVLKEGVRAVVDAGGLDLVIGSSHRRGMTGARRVPFLELGVPSYHHHAFAPSPYYGFPGATCLLERIVNLLNDAP